MWLNTHIKHGNSIENAELQDTIWHGLQGMRASCSKCIPAQGPQHMSAQGTKITCIIEEGS